MPAFKHKSLPITRIAIFILVLLISIYYFLNSSSDSLKYSSNSITASKKEIDTKINITEKESKNLKGCNTFSINPFLHSTINNCEDKYQAEPIEINGLVTELNDVDAMTNNLILLKRGDIYGASRLLNYLKKCNVSISYIDSSQSTLCQLALSNKDQAVSLLETLALTNGSAQFELSMWLYQLDELKPFGEASVRNETPNLGSKSRAQKLLNDAALGGNTEAINMLNMRQETIKQLAIYASSRK